MGAQGAKVRAAAAEIVDAVVQRGLSLDVALRDGASAVSVTDHPLLKLLCYGTLRHHWQLRSWIALLIERPLRKRDQVIQSLLAVGLYQLTSTRVPDHAVVSATVDAARELRRPKLAGLVNACLRRFMRDELSLKKVQDEECEWNHPQWMIDQTRRDWPDDWKSILDANNQQAPMWLRANTRVNSAEAYLARLEAEGISGELLAASPHAIRLLSPRGVDTLPGFTSGDASVQDAAAQLAAPWLLKQPGNRVLDACAAPGGKTGHLLELGVRDLTAVDSEEGRLSGVADNLRRIGLDATIIAADASKPETWWDGRPFDGILLDAPCSASGVIRRHPDIKLLRRERDVKALATLQRDLLHALWPLLAPGGTLLYATCSIFSTENDAVVGQFLQDLDDVSENDVLPNNNIRDLMRKKACGFQILPGTEGMDGFYYAALQKKVS